MTRKHGKFKGLALEAEQRKEFALSKGNGLTGNGQLPHDLWRVVVPTVRMYNKGYVDVVLLYTYLLANVNGQRDNDRYMSAFPSVPRIAKETGIGRNRIANLSEVLVAVGLLKTTYDYTGNKRNKLYYPQYYTELNVEQMRYNLSSIT